MRNRFDRQLEELNNEMISMGVQISQAIGNAINALSSQNVDKAKEAIAYDEEIDQKEREIESLCFKLLLSQQPVARDLRQISAALKMVTDMERIGDQAEDIAELTAYLNGRTRDEHHLIREMANATIRMVTESVDAYVKQDLNLAGSVIAYDDVVDTCFQKVKSSLIDYIAKNPADGEYALDLLMVAKYFERIGDHATNIAEWVQFSITGEIVKDETTE